MGRLSPPDPELAGYLKEHPEDAWEVMDLGAAWDEMRGELTQGGWLLYAAPEPFSEVAPDTFRAPAVDIIDFMCRAGVTHFVDSFHDDTEWVIGLMPEADA